MAVDTIARGMAGNDDAILNYIQETLAAFPNGLKFKGWVDYYSDLPDSEQAVGDSYIVKYKGSSGTDPDGTQYAWGNYDGTEQWGEVTPKNKPEYMLTVTPEWGMYMNEGETTPDITLPDFGTPVGTQTMLYAFVAATANASFTAPSDAMLIETDGTDTYTTGNTITYENLEVGVLYLMKFQCFTAGSSHNYIVMQSIGYNIA